MPQVVFVFSSDTTERKKFGQFLVLTSFVSEYATRWLEDTCFLEAVNSREGSLRHIRSDLLFKTLTAARETNRLRDPEQRQATR
jgi:hypothetical protein